MTPRALSKLHANAPARQQRPPRAATVLGPGHPVARAALARHVLGCQVAVAGALVVVSFIDAIARSGAAVAFLSSAAVVELGLLCAFAFAYLRLRERARDYIADVDDCVAIAEIAAERARLASVHQREQLARNLERAMHAAEHWHELSITSRPPPTVRHLLGCIESARDVALLVRDPTTRVRGVALLDRLVCGGYSSALYAGCPDLLARELARIRFLLQAG